MFRRFACLWLAPLFLYQMMQVCDDYYLGWERRAQAWWKIHGEDRWA